MLTAFVSKPLVETGLGICLSTKFEQRFNDFEYKSNNIKLELSLNIGTRKFGVRQHQHNCFCNVVFKLTALSRMVR
jgi:hypothetical protein